MVSDKVKLVIAEMKAEVPGNATWCCWELGDLFNEQVMKMIGHQVVEVSPECAKMLIDEMKTSIELQVKLRALFYPGAT